MLLISGQGEFETGLLREQLKPWSEFKQKSIPIFVSQKRNKLKAYMAHPLLVFLIFPKYFPVRIKHVITENLPTGFDLTSVISRHRVEKSLIVIPSRNIKDENLILRHINLSNFELVPNWRNQDKFRRVCMGCYQTLIPYISIGNCNSELVFGMRASFRIIYKNMASYSIIWKKYFCDVITSGLYLV